MKIQIGMYLDEFRDHLDCATRTLVSTDATTLAEIEVDLVLAVRT
jgi:hypothetical protein